MRHECAEMKVEVVAFGGVADHVHLLARIPTTPSIAALVKQVKGSSSHLVGQKLRVAFKWQGGYGAFTLAKHDVRRIRDYFLRQEEHHRARTLDPLVELPQPDSTP